LSTQPPDYYGDGDPLPRPGEPYQPFDRPDSGPSEALRTRVQLPAIFLMVVAGLNLLAGFYFLYSAVMATITPGEIQKEQQETVLRAFGIDPQQIAQFAKTPEETRNMAMVVNWTLAGLALLGSVVTLLGGIGMSRFRWYGLALAGSVIAAIPCVSCLGCCGAGEGIGIWSLVVLLSDDVKAAFH
jgi:hypothetical protein